jgi:preprotein translocase subunit SecE
MYKKGQGKYTRGLTMGSGALLVILGAYWLWDSALGTWTRGSWLLAKALVCGLVVLGGGWLTFRLTYGKQRTGDFLIATEGEMKKVSWSTRKEIIASTQVVIFTLIFMGVLLFVVDVFFMFIFDVLGVLKTDPISKIFTTPKG